MAKKLSPESELIAAYGTAMTAAFQCLVVALQNNGALNRGEFQRVLADYMKISTEERGNDLVINLLRDLQQGLLD